MEKDNKKERDKARKSYNEQIRVWTNPFYLFIYFISKK